MAVGTSDGRIILLNATNGQQMASKQLTAPALNSKTTSSTALYEPVDCIKYSPGETFPGAYAPYDSWIEMLLYLQKHSHLYCL